jgi:hypothetical protein
MAEIKAGRLSDYAGILGMYINDCIHYRMIPEQVLFYSENCFGTSDAISFRYNKLRISDLKTGVIKGSVHQLEVYAALFCLEYGKDPFDIGIELRIYQDDEVIVYDADPEDIMFIMDKIQEFDTLIGQLRREEESWFDPKKIILNITAFFDGLVVILGDQDLPKVHVIEVFSILLIIW